MKSRKVPTACLSLLLIATLTAGRTDASPCPTSTLSSRATSLLSVWLGSAWSLWRPAWEKSRGTMDPDGTLSPDDPPPVDPSPLLPVDRIERSRGTMDPDGLPVT